MNFEIEPHIGIGLVKLGMSRVEVKEALGDDFYSGSHGRSDYYFSNSLQIEFLEGKTDFIGASYSDQYTVIYHGQNVFDITSEALFNIIAKNESANHSYVASEYLFLDQILTLWDADDQYDHIRGEEREVWAQVGIGSSSYLKAVS